MKIYDEFTKDFNNNGIGILKDIFNAECVESLNGELILTFEYPKKSKYSEFLKNRNIVKADVGFDEEQIFRIKRVVPNIDNITITAYHITYDLIDNLIEDVYPQNKSGQDFLDWIFERTQYKHDFKCFSDITSLGTARYVRKNPIEILIGNIDNNFINIFGGELLRDNFKINMLKHRGTDNGYKIKYRKNLTGLEITKDDSNLTTRLMPEGFDGLFLPEKYVDSPLISQYSHPYIKVLDCKEVKLKSDNSDEGFDTLEQCYEEMRKICNEAFEKDNIDKTSINIKVDFVDLKKTNLYKKYIHLQNLKMGDTVTVIDGNKIYKLRIIKTYYDLNLHTFTKLELGEFKNNFVSDTNSKINSTREKITESSENILEKAKKNATDLLTNAMGGYVYKTQNELFIMDTNDPKTAKKVWRWNLNGLGYSSSGINGPYNLAMTQEGQIIADFITAGILKGLQITNGNGFSVDPQGNMKSTSGEIGGFKITSNSLSTSGSKKYTYKMADAEKVVRAITGAETLTDEEIIKYDINQDGEINIVDATLILNTINGTTSETPTFSGKFEINNNSLSEFIKIYNNDGTLKTTIGLGTATFSRISANQLFSNDVHGKKGTFVDLDVTGTFNNSSDKNKKENIKELDDKYEDLLELIKPHIFNFIDDENKKEHIGFIAQEVENAFEQIGIIASPVIKRENPIEKRDDYFLEYNQFLGIMWKILQIQRKEIKKLKKGDNIEKNL